MSSVTAPQARGVGAPQARGVGAPQARGVGAPQARGVGAPARAASTSPGRPAPGRAVPARPPLRVVPTPVRRPARAPFVALVVALLGGGLVALLLLNTALSQGAFVESALEERNTTLAEREQQLQRKATRLAAPQELAERARELGMVPGGPPAFLDERTGEVSGESRTSRGSAPVEQQQGDDGADGDATGDRSGARSGTR